MSQTEKLLDNGLESYLENYLKNYAETEAQHAPELFDSSAQYDYVLCLPCYDENVIALQRFIDFCHRHRALLIVVINQPDSISQPTPENVAAMQQLQHAETCRQKNNITLISNSSSASVLLIDRFTPDRQIPQQRGVGLARKIACDCALALIRRLIVASKWIHCTDADVTLPFNYFEASRLHTDSDCAALIYPHTHSNINATEDNVCIDDCISIDDSGSLDNRVVEATTLYEQHLEHYVAGLRYAGSPYAFHTLGSTLCLSAKHMAIVRGFPARSGGEDFYLLNKLCKVGKIVSLREPTLNIAVRLSHRVPFGTGPAVARLSGLDAADKNTREPFDARDQKLFYHPFLFEYLKRLQEWFKFLTHTLAENRTNFDWKQQLSAFVETANESSISIEVRMLSNTLQQLGFQRCMDHCRSQCNTAEQVHKQIDYWFDALRTLRFLHLLRDSRPELGNLSWHEINQLELATT